MLLAGDGHVGRKTFGEYAIGGVLQDGRDRTALAADDVRGRI